MTMLTYICLLSAVACVYGADNRLSLSADAAAQIIDYIFNNDGLGNYKFGFSTTNGIERFEESTVENPNTEQASTIVKGSYSYPGADGKMIKVKYTADKDGFHPESDIISVPPYVASDNKAPAKEPQGQRFNRQYTEEADNYNENPANFDYHMQVSQLLQQDDQYANEPFIPYNQNLNYNSDLQENSANHFAYDKSLLEFLGGSNNQQQHSNYNQQSNRQKPIIAILGDDGKLINTANFDNLNLPESVLELLSRGNAPIHNEVPVIPEKPKLKEKGDFLVKSFKAVKEELPTKNKDSKKAVVSSTASSITTEQYSTETTLGGIITTDASES